MQKIKLTKYTLLFLVTTIVLILWMMGITLLKNSWYTLLIIIDLYFLRSYIFENSKSYSIDKVVNICCILGILVCIVGIFNPMKPQKHDNYMYSPNKTHKVVIQQSSRNRDGYLDIYKQHFILFKYRKMEHLEVKNGHPLMTSDLAKLEGNVFSGKDYYNIGQITFKWVTEDELLVYCNPNQTSISIKF